MKKPVTFRLDQEVLAQARQSAQAENRTLTNFIETLIKWYAEKSSKDPSKASTAPAQRPSGQPGRPSKQAQK